MNSSKDALRASEQEEEIPLQEIGISTANHQVNLPLIPQFWSMTCHPMNNNQRSGHQDIQKRLKNQALNIYTQSGDRETF
jgi:hypothetical protein